MLKKSWASAIIDYLTANYPNELERNDMDKTYSAIYRDTWNTAIPLIPLTVSGQVYTLRPTDLIFLIGCLSQDYLKIRSGVQYAIAWIGVNCNFFPDNIIAWKNIREAFENNHLIIEQGFISTNQSASGVSLVLIHSDSANDKVTINLNFNSSLTLAKFFNENFSPIVSGNFQVEYIINKNYKTTDKIDLVNVNRVLSSNSLYRDLKVKIKFYPLTNEVGYDRAPFGLDLSNEDLIEKYLEEIGGGSLEENMNKEIKKYSPEYYKQRATKFKELFYRYTGIKPGTPITEEDIRKNRFGAFNRIAIYNGCTDEELVEALLK